MVALSVQAYSVTLPLEQPQQQGGSRDDKCVDFKRSVSTPVAYHSPSLRHCHGGLDLTPTRNPSPAYIITLSEQGKLSAALDALSLLLISPSDEVYFIILKACNRLRDAHVVRRFLGYLLQHNVDLTGSLGNSFVETLARCGCIEEAFKVFYHVHQRSVSTWTALMSACNKCKQSERTLELYLLMQKDGIEPNSHAYVSLFKACSVLHNFYEGKKLHEEAKAKGVTLDIYVNNSLVNMYGKCGDIAEAEHVFYAMPERNLTSWTSMMSAYVDTGQGEKALQLYRFMLAVNVFPNQHTFAVAIQACCIIFDKRKFSGIPIKSLCLEIGQALHADARQSPFISNVFVSTTLVHMYGKLGKIQEAENIFFSVSQLDSILCNAMLYAYVEQGQGELALQLYRHMLWQHVFPDQKTFVLVVQACGVLAESEESVVVDGHSVKEKSFEICQALHDDAQRRGFSSNVFLRTTFLGVYAKCGIIEEAEKMFVEFDRPDVVSWTAMMSAYVEQGNEKTALRLFRQMQEEGICANTQTFVVVVQACASLGDKAEDPAGWELPFEIGIALHADAKKKGLESNVFLNTALLSMYGMCGSTRNAELIFGTMPHRDLVAWNAMIKAYVGQEEGIAFQMYSKMLQEGIVPNEKTFVSVLQACGTLLEKEEVDYMPKLVIALHDDVRKRGLTSDVFIGNTLVTVYGIMGYLEEAEKAFYALSYYQIVSWNAMLSAYVQHGQGEKALQLYNSMQIKGTTVNDITLVCILQACIQTGHLELCKQMHFSIVSAGNELNPSLASSLMGAYGNCGSMLDAQAVFDALPLPDVVTWNVCLSGYAGEGNYEASMQILNGMHVTGVKPDAVTFTSVLSACSHGGFLTQGLWYFEFFCRHFEILPDSRHFSSIIDLLGRAGDLECLEMMLKRLPIRTDLNVWLPLLGACCLHGNAELAKQAFTRALSLKPDNASAFIIMSNMYADFALQEFMADGEDFQSTWESVKLGSSIWS